MESESFDIDSAAATPEVRTEVVPLVMTPNSSQDFSVIPLGSEEREGEVCS